MEKRAAGLRSSRQAGRCTHSQLGPTIQHIFLGQLLSPKWLCLGLEPCLTKIRKAFEPHGLDSQGKWPLLRAPTSRLFPRQEAALVSVFLRGGALVQGLSYLSLCF